MEKSVKSYAKINISLNIKYKRDDGYHELDSVMVPIELHDSLIISDLKTASDNFVTVDDFSNGLVHYNLVGSAIDALSKKYKFNNKYRVYIHKNIPMQAGLGGGSSNAATIMKTVNGILKLGATNEEMIKLAAPLGADIPFFILGVPARCRGIGEIVEPIEIKNNYQVLVVKPTSGCSTKEVFALCDKKPYPQVDIETVLKALREGDDDLLASVMGNSLEASAMELVPEIKTIKDRLKDMGFKLVLMSGSGSTVFALSTNTALLKKAQKELEDDYFVEITKIRK